MGFKVLSILIILYFTNVEHNKVITVSLTDADKNDMVKEAGCLSGIDIEIATNCEKVRAGGKVTWWNKWVPKKLKWKFKKMAN